MVEMLTVKKLAGKILICLAALAVLMCICALVGTQSISFSKVMQGPSQTDPNIDYQIFVGVRLPRLILAALVGAALACAGVTLQAILRNPLAYPYILGISSGAGLGAIIAVIAGLSWTFWGGSALTVCAFLGALATVWLVWLVGTIAGKYRITSLLLAGVGRTKLFEFGQQQNHPQQVPENDALLFLKAVARDKVVEVAAELQQLARCPNRHNSYVSRAGKVMIKQDSQLFGQRQHPHAFLLENTVASSPVVVVLILIGRAELLERDQAKLQQLEIQTRRGKWTRW